MSAVTLRQNRSLSKRENGKMDSTILKKIAFFAIAIPAVLLLGSIFPGIAHVVFAAAAVKIYQETFPG